MDASARMENSPLADFAGLPPVLIAGSSDHALNRASQTVEAAGYRAATVRIDDALDRLTRQVSASALWLELDEDIGLPLDRLLDRLEAEVGAGRFPAIVAAPAALIDPIAARLHSSAIELLVDATPADRAAALALVTARRGAGQSVHDVASETNTIRLRQLSDEVSRIAATLARLSVGPGSGLAERPQAAAHDSEPPAIALDQVRQVIRARRLRARFFEEELFADPAWDMLLDLLQAEIAQHRVPVSSLCIAAAVPATTALRWIKSMTDADLFRRRADPHDGRRVFVELSPDASAAMRRYFGEVGRLAVV